MLKDEIKKELEIDLPISGGNGTSLENAVVIHHEEFSDFYSVENAVQRYLFARHCLAQKLLRQELITCNGRVYDHFIYYCEYKEGREEDFSLTDLYFDITEGWNKKMRRKA